jgi:hypothetical protein
MVGVKFSDVQASSRTRRRAVEPGFSETVCCIVVLVFTPLEFPKKGDLS